MYFSLPPSPLDAGPLEIEIMVYILSAIKSIKLVGNKHLSHAAVEVGRQTEKDSQVLY